MNLLLVRRHVQPFGMIGDFSINGTWRYFTVERVPTDLIRPCPAGMYQVTLRQTFNSHLWTPYEDRILPHIENVPGR